MSRKQSPRRHESIAPGDKMPLLSVPVTAQLIVGGAIASRDYQDVHHDQDGARALGAPNIFMNILTTNGLVGRYVSDWAGPGSLLKSLSIRLGVPCYPGDTLKLSGEVLNCDGRQAELQVSGQNSRGEHVSGSATVALPAEPVP